MRFQGQPGVQHSKMQKSEKSFPKHKCWFGWESDDWLISQPGSRLLTTAAEVALTTVWWSICSAVVAEMYQDWSSAHRRRIGVGPLQPRRFVYGTENRNIYGKSTSTLLKRLRLITCWAGVWGNSRRSLHAARRPDFIIAPKYRVLYTREPALTAQDVVQKARLGSEGYLRP